MCGVPAARLGFITGMACSVEMESDCSVIKKQAPPSNPTRNLKPQTEKMRVESFKKPCGSRS